MQNGERVNDVDKLRLVLIRSTQSSPMHIFPNCDTKSLIVFFSLLLFGSTAIAYDAVVQRNAQLKSINGIHAVAISTIIDYRFFETIKPGDSKESVTKKMRERFGDSPIGVALRFDGRIKKNIESLLSARLLERLSIQTVNWKTAPYKVDLNARINQSQDLYGANIFEVRIRMDAQEFGTTNSGYQGFLTVETFFAQTFADTKEGVEGALYEGMEKAFDQLVEASRTA